MSFPYPDENTWWNDFTIQVNDRYAQAGHPGDDGKFKWFSRTAFDIGTGALSPDASAAKHLRELSDALGLPQPEPPPGPSPGNRIPAGTNRLATHTLIDDNGPYLGRCFSFFWVLRAFKDFKDRYDANMAWGASKGKTAYRGLCTIGGWPTPDPWLKAGMGRDEAYQTLPGMLDDAFGRYRLRCSLTLFDGMNLFPTFAEQDSYVRHVCSLLVPRLHVLNDIQIANEYGPTGWQAHPQGVTWLRAHARTVRELLGSQVILSLSSRTTAMNDGSHQEAVNEAQALFDLGILSASVNHDSREMGMIDGPWRHARQGWERVLHDQQGRPVEPDASIDDEPAGPRSSVNEESNVSRLVSKAMIDFIAGRAMHTYHPDSGIWSDLLNPPQRGMGEFRLIQDHPASNPFGDAMQKLCAVLPADLPNWNRTRHGLPGHPFGPSFEQRPTGFTQIWPDGFTSHGVVRAYCAIRGDDFVCSLAGIRDRIELRFARALSAKVYACGTGEQIAEFLAPAMNSAVLRQSQDTDLVIIGHYL